MHRSEKKKILQIRLNLCCKDLFFWCSLSPHSTHFVLHRQEHSTCMLQWDNWRLYFQLLVIFQGAYHYHFFLTLKFSPVSKPSKAQRKFTHSAEIPLVSTCH